MPSPLWCYDINRQDQTQPSTTADKVFYAMGKSGPIIFGYNWKILTNLDDIQT